MEIFIFPDENGSIVTDTVSSDRPIDISEFMKLCEQRRKFPVLYKLEFEVRKVSLIYIKIQIAWFFSSRLPRKPNLIPADTASRKAI